MCVCVCVCVCVFCVILNKPEQILTLLNFLVDIEVSQCIATSIINVLYYHSNYIIKRNHSKAMAFSLFLTFFLFCFFFLEKKNVRSHFE